MRLGLRGFFAGAVATAAIAACFVDLDPPLGAVEPDVEAGPIVPDDVIAPPPADVAVEAAVKPECTVETDCKPEDAPGTACLKPSCIAGKCEYAVCGATGASCSIKTCNRVANACNATATAIPFSAGTFNIDLSLPIDFACNVTTSSPTRCFAAVYPYLFVAERGSDPNANAYAFDVSDPTNPNPVGIKISGIDFPSQSVVASGRRVYFVDANSTNKIGWVDVPSNPYVTTMSATTVAATYLPSRPTIAFPASSGGLYLVATTTAARFDPVAFDPADSGVRLLSIASASGAAVAADSTHLYYTSAPAGGRLLWGAATFPGTGVAIVQGGLVDSGVVPLGPTPYYAGSPDALLANLSTLRTVDGGTTRLDRVSLRRFDGGQSPDSFPLQTYADASASSSNLRAAGPVVAVDGGAVAVVAKDDVALTAVAKRVAFDSFDPGGAVDLDASPANVNDLTMLASNGYAYVVHYKANDKKIYVDILAADCPVAP